jgi:Fe-Mn family superoxide dismutase
MTYNFIKQIILNESSSNKDLEILKLPYARSDLSPAVSEDTVNYHYGKLYKGYVDRYNSKDGDPEFNYAGAFLHFIYFSQFKEYGNSNPLSEKIKDFVDQHFEDVDDLKKQIETEAMAIQGSGWVYLSQSGKIKTIKNHATRSDILLLIDWWEHAWALDYQADKKEYLKNLWNIIDWAVIESRISNPIIPVLV